MKAVTRLFGLGIGASVAAAKASIFEACIPISRDIERREWRGGPREAIIKQQVVASSRKFMSDARCGTIHRFELNF